MDPRRHRDLYLSLRMQGRVIWTLMVREFHSRAGHWGVRHLSALFETIVVVGILMIAFRAAREIAPLGMDAAPVFAAGFIPSACFRRTHRRSRRGKRLRGTLSYPQVNAIDADLANTALSLLTMVVVLVAMAALIRLFDVGPWPHSWLGIVGVMALAALLGFGFGLVVKACTVILPIVESVANVLSRILFVVSGVFFVPAMIPEPYRDIFLLNPLLHITEMARTAYFASFDDGYASLSYVGWWIVSLMFLGLLGQRLTRRHAFGR